jgi:acyl-CoA reductase-like NAD-dependent aldehyde dehydrogenase
MSCSRGPVISPAAKARVTGLIASADEQGGKIWLDGRGIEVPGYPDGNFIGMQVRTDVVQPITSSPRTDDH